MVRSAPPPDHRWVIHLHRKTLALVLWIGLATLFFCRAAAQDANDPFPGNPPVAPRWVFEPWVWEDNENTRQVAEQLVQGYLTRDIPVGAVLIDSPWETEYNTFIWDTGLYPQPEEMIANFHAQGVRVILWITGFVNLKSPDYEYVNAQGYLVDDGQGVEWWKGWGFHIDFTNPAALEWWHDKMDGPLGMGIDGWKVDNSTDELGDMVKTTLGDLSREVFEKYYYADFLDYSLTQNPQIAVLARAYSHQGGFGSSISKQTVGWSGDFNGDFSGLEDQKNEVYASAQSGYGAPGVEVGGFVNEKPTRNSLIRYAQFGALTPLMMNGGSNGGLKQHLPWFWDAEMVEIYRYYATLHSELVPYLFSYSVEANQTGISILRETDQNASHHKLGEELFVSAITSPDETKTVALPAEAQWIDYWDEGRLIAGGSSDAYNQPIHRYPIYIKAGAIIPLNVRNAVTHHGDSSSAGKTTLLIYPYNLSGYTFHRPTGDGTEYSDVVVTVDEAQGTITVSGDISVPYRLRVKSFTPPADVSGADRWSYDPDSDLVIADKLGEDFIITISGLDGYGETVHPTETVGPPSVTATSGAPATISPTPLETQTTTPEWTATVTPSVAVTANVTATGAPAITSAPPTPQPAAQPSEGAPSSSGITKLIFLCGAIGATGVFIAILVIVLRLFNRG